MVLGRFLEHFRGKLVLVSSGAVYHSLRGPVTPTTPLTPLHPYAVSKLAAERLALAHAAAGRLAGLVVLWLFHALGAGERPSRLIPQLLTPVVDVQPVQSVAEAITAAAGIEADGLVVDICRGGGKRLVEVVNEVGAALGIQPQIETAPAEAEEPIEFVPDPRPARALLGLWADEDLGPSIRA